MKDNLKKLLDALVESGKDFSVDSGQTEIRLWLDNWSLVLDSNGKWRLE